jgi:hypothetical protein
MICKTKDKPTRMNRIGHLVIALLACVLLRAAPVAAAETDAGLLWLVGEDAGLVVEVTGLKDQLPKLQNCEVFRRLQETTVFQQWKASDSFRKLDLSKTVIEKLARKTLKQIVDDLFGRSIVLAVYPTEKDEAHTVLITRASSAETVQSAVALWNRIDPSELTRTAIEGYESVRRTRVGPDGKPLPPQFYVVFDDIFAFSDNEAAIRRVITLRAAVASSSPADRNDLKAKSRRHYLLSSAHRAARDALTPKRFVSLYLNPRAWDDRLDFGADKSKAAAFMSNVWRGCDAIAFSLSVEERGVFVEGMAHYDGRGIVPAVQRSLANGGEPETRPTFLNHVPRRAIAVFAGRHDLAEVAKGLMGWIPDQQQADWSRLRQLGRGLLVGFDLFDDVLPALGPNWGTYIVASPGGTADQSPLDAIIGVELQPPGQKTRGKITLRDGLDNALETTLHLIGSISNTEASGKTSEVETESTQTGTQIRSIKAGKTLNPAYALTANHLVVGTSPDSLNEFIGLNADDSLAADPAFRNAARLYFPKDSQLLYVNVAALRQVIADQGSLLSSRIASSENISLDASKKRVEILSDLLQAFDTVFVAAHADSHRGRLIWGIVANPPDDAASR